MVVLRLAGEDNGASGRRQTPDFGTRFLHNVEPYDLFLSLPGLTPQVGYT